MAASAGVGSVFCLKGDLGAGKTEFARGFIRALSGDVAVASPTFNLVKIYETPGFPIWHFDLYRLKNAAELEELGLSEALIQAVSLIEWPEIAEGMLPRERVEVEIKDEGEGARVVRVRS